MVFSFAKIDRLLVVACLTSSLMARSIGQTQVFVSHQDRPYLVVAMDGEYPIIDGEGGRERIFSTKMSMQRANRFTDGGIRVLQKDAVMGQDYGSNQGNFFFRFRVEIQADRDFEDCFILIAIAPEEGSETILMREVEDIEAGATDVVDIIVPVNPGFGGGGYGYHLYSQGEEIKVDDPLAKAVIRQQGLETSNRGAPQKQERPREPPQLAFPARATKTVMPDFPLNLEGKNISGLAQVTFAIDSSGKVVEILGMAADHSAFLIEARESILASSYEPATYNNESLFTTVTQVFTFNEFVSFAEALEMIPYPNLPDSQPRLLHSPIETLKASGIDFAESSVVLHGVIDPLGRIQQARIREANDQRVADMILDTASEWVFIPAIQDGRPVARRIQIPINQESTSSEN